MSRDIALLDPAFQAKAKLAEEACAARGVIMRCFYTERSVYDQAKLWRQSRSSEHIAEAIDKLQRLGAPFLADVLLSVGPCTGPEVTGALPGESWHQFGLAKDSFWLYKSKAIWSGTATKDINGSLVNGYRVYWEEAHALGLTTITYAGGRKKDWPHIQGREESSPLKLMSWRDVDSTMQKRFGE